MVAELWDIARHVEEHPDDSEQRWRLAKKLYTAWEYRLALEHLQILKKEWRDKANVWRYLAATYYRLGRYDEAIVELRAAIETWPDEIGLLEQLARVLEVSDKRLEAVETWRKIEKMDPHHPIASKAAKRLTEEKPPSEQSDLQLGDSDSGIDLSPGQVCPRCGAQNSSEFDRCWQCHAFLNELESTGASTPPPLPRRRPMLTPETIGLSAGLFVLALLLLGAYLSLRWVLFKNQTGLPRIDATLYDIYCNQMVWSRMIVGGALLFIWPIALWLALLLVKPKQPVPASWIILTGLFLTGLTYVSSWLPEQLLMLTVLLPPLLALSIILGGFSIGLLRGFNVWLLHLAIVGVCTITVWTVTESIQLRVPLNPFKEIPAIIKFSKTDKNIQNNAVYKLTSGTLPLSKKVKWVSTGSRWLDSRAGQALFTLYTVAPDPQMKFEIHDSTGTLLYEPVFGKQWSRRFLIKTEHEYDITAHGPKELFVQIDISSMLKSQF